MAARPGRGAGRAGRDAAGALHRRTRPPTAPSWCAPTRCRSDDALTNAVGLLQEEMRRARLAGHARAPTRIACRPAARSRSTAIGFARAVTERLASHPRSRSSAARSPSCRRRTEARSSPPGPLTAPRSAERSGACPARRALLLRRDRADRARDSIDMDMAWLRRARRYETGRRRRRLHELPARTRAVRAFVAAVLAGEKLPTSGVRSRPPYFEGCLPIEVMAERGPTRSRFGPMKPVGLTDPRTGRRPYAVVQLRQDERARHALQPGRLPDQADVRRAEARSSASIPGLEQRGVRALGAVHRNTFIERARAARRQLRAERATPRLRFAGQITGVEGYVESAAIGLLAGRFAAARARSAPAWCRRRRPPRSARCCATSPVNARQRQPSSR